jgi:hypothetical protein
MTEATTKDYPWKFSPKPCRFLMTRVYDSGISGIPAGTEESCTHSIYGNIQQLMVIANSLKECLAPHHLGVVPGGIVVEDKAFNGAVDLISKLLKVLNEIGREHPQSSRDRYYSKSNDEAAREHLAVQLGDIANSRQGSQLMEWLLGKGEEDDGR